MGKWIFCQLKETTDLVEDTFSSAVESDHQLVEWCHRQPGATVVVWVLDWSTGGVPIISNNYQYVWPGQCCHWLQSCSSVLFTNSNWIRVPLKYWEIYVGKNSEKQEVMSLLRLEAHRLQVKYHSRLQSSPAGSSLGALMISVLYS